MDSFNKSTAHSSVRGHSTYKFKLKSGVSIPSLVLIPLMLFHLWATLKFLHNDNSDLAITIAQLFLRNRQANNERWIIPFKKFSRLRKSMKSIKI